MSEQTTVTALLPLNSLHRLQAALAERAGVQSSVLVAAYSPDGTNDRAGMLVVDPAFSTAEREKTPAAFLREFDRERILLYMALEPNAVRGRLAFVRGGVSRVVTLGFDDSPVAIAAAVEAAARA